MGSVPQTPLTGSGLCWGLQRPLGALLYGGQAWRTRSPNISTLLSGIADQPGEDGVLEPVRWPKLSGLGLQVTYWPEHVVAKPRTEMAPATVRGAVGADEGTSANIPTGCCCGSPLGLTQPLSPAQNTCGRGHCGQGTCLSSCESSGRHGRATPCHVAKLSHVDFSS